MGSVVFTDSYQISSYGYYEQNVEVNFTESYNPATNKTTVTLSSIRMKSEYAGGSSPVYGDVSFSANGSSWTSVKSMNGGTNQVNLATSYSVITGSSGGSLDITHAADGTATLYVKLSGGSGGYWGALVHTYGKPQRMFGIETPDTESTSLTTHTVTLTVKPNGGTWNGSTSQQTFTQAPQSTKTIADPGRTGYAFSGWSLSGGGSISGTTYTFGSSNGTLTAGWAINSYTVTCKDYVGSTSGALLGTKTASYNYGSSVSGASFGSSTTYDTYYTGYHYTSSSSAVTVPANNNTVVYRYFAKNTWTVSYNANGGSSTPSSQTKTYGTALTLSLAIARANSSPGSYTVTYDYNGSGKSDTTATSVRTTTYTFSKWNTKQDGSGTNYNASASYTANAAATMYAQWTSSTTAAAVTLPSATRTGYTFDGWYDAASGGSKIGNAGASYTPTGNKTLYAHWTIITYTFKATAGTDIASVSLNGTSSATSVTKTVNYGSTNTFIATLGSNVAFNYTFSGWYSGTTKVSSNLTYTPASATAGLDLTAKASKTAKSYTLSFTKPNTGGSAEVRRTSSPNGGGSIGVLNNGATIYYGDVLQVSYTENPGYEVETHTINGSTFTTPATVTVTGAVNVVVTMKNAGVVWIWNGSTWERYIPMIWNGSSWDRYIPMVWTGSAWEIY